MKISVGFKVTEKFSKTSQDHSKAHEWFESKTESDKNKSEW